MKVASLWLSILLAVIACTPDPEPEPQVEPEPAQAPPEPQAQAQPAAPPAEAAPQVRLRGTVQALEGPVLTVLTESDGPVAVTVGPNVGINGLAARTLDDIGDNTFVGTTAVRGSDGRWDATEVHIFPEAMRGAGEGHYPWDLPESTMTNAAVTGTATAGEDRTLKLRYATGEVEVDVGPDVPIVELVPGDRSLLVSGATVFVLGAPDGDMVNAFAILAEKDGVKPPM
jgi:hypothetical protein